MQFTKMTAEMSSRACSAAENDRHTSRAVQFSLRRALGHAKQVVLRLKEEG
jgi:hypothetical protein